MLTSRVYEPKFELLSRETPLSNPRAERVLVTGSFTGDRLEVDLDSFLAQPLVAHLATQGPTIRPIWFLWEEQAFWWLTGPWSHLETHLRREPSVALVVDTCNLETGEVSKVVAKGEAELQPYDPQRARRKLRRYLGDDEALWDSRFDPDRAESGTKFVRLRPSWLRARDLSYTPSSAAGPPIGDLFPPARQPRSK